MAGDEADAKRLKSSGASPRGSDDVIKLKTESEHSGDSSPRCLKATSKPPEPPKQDYIHVRARRGQATDSHSLAERVRTIESIGCFAHIITNSCPLVVHCARR